jgi:hypothetical protein
MGTVEVVGLGLLGFVVIGGGSFVLSLVVAVRVVAVIGVIPAGIPGWVVSMESVVGVSLFLLGLVGIGNLIGSLVVAVRVLSVV